MARMSHMNGFVALLISAFAISGCQSANNKWATAWRERNKPKTTFQDPTNKEEVVYWPYTKDNKNQPTTPMPDSLKDKIAKKNEQNKQTTQLAELIKEGDQLRKNGQLDDANIVYNKALAMSPDNPTIHHRMAIVADNQHQFPLADEHYQAALRARPRDVNLLSDLGYSYSLRGDTRQAELTLKEALAIDPYHKGAMANLGSIYAQQNRHEDALAMFRTGATESEAQQYMAKLFPRGNSGPIAVPDQGHSSQNAMTAAVAPNGRIDLSQLSLEDIQAEMARRKQEGIRRREVQDQHEKSQMMGSYLDDRNDGRPGRQNPTQLLAQNNANGLQGAANNPIVIGPSGPSNSYTNRPGTPDLAARAGAGNMPIINANNQSSGSPAERPYNGSNTAEIFRGTGSPQMTSRPMDPQIQRAMNQQGGAGMNGVQQVNGSMSAARMATQLGMSAGPGNMFPMVSGPSPDASATGPTTNFENGSGGELQQASAYQDPALGPGNSPDPLADSNSFSSQYDGSASIAPASPASNWGTQVSGSPSWQNMRSSSTSWAGEVQNGTGSSDSANVMMDKTMSWEQTETRRNDSFDAMQGTNPPARSRNSNESIRTFNGAWPRTNSLPGRQNQGPPGNTQSDVSDTVNVNMFNNANPNGQMPPSNSSNRSVPQWPFTPNR